MSRLSFVPPHLMDMPGIGLVRAIPSQQIGGQDLITLAADFPAYNADFSQWTGVADGPEQEMPSTVVWDFENAYDDDEFWGYDADTPAIIRGYFSASGVWTQIASHPIVFNTITSNIRRTEVSAGASRMAFLRLNKAQALVMIMMDYGSSAYYVGFNLFNLANGAFTLVKQAVNVSSSARGDLEYYLGFAQAAKLSDTFAVLYANSKVSSYDNMYGVNVATSDAGIWTGRYQIYQNTNAASDPTRRLFRVGASRVVRIGYRLDRNNTDRSSLCTFDLNTGGAGVPANPGQGSDAGLPLDDNYSGGGQPINRRFFLPLTGTQAVFYRPLNRSLNLISYGASGTSLLSTLVLGYDLQEITRLSGTEFLIVYPDPVDGTKGRTQRVIIAPDGTMSLQQSARNFAAVPFGSDSTYYRSHQGTVMASGRVLMLGRRDGGPQGTVLAKVLKAA